MSEGTRKKMITFNGINGETGDYLTDPLTAEELMERVNRSLWKADHLKDLNNRQFGSQASLRVLPEYGDGSDLKRVGWGIIFPARAAPDRVDKILLALDKLIQLRKEAAGGKFKILPGWSRPPLEGQQA